MDTLDQHVLELIQKSYSCSQIIYMLSEDFHQEKSPNLVKALYGLSNGMFQEKTCGALTGGYCLLSLYLGKEEDKERDEEKTALLIKLIHQLNDWFIKSYNSSECGKILKEYDNDKMFICPKLISTTFTKCIELLSENNIDIYEI